jgi:hypothetical protein
MYVDAQLANAIELEKFAVIAEKDVLETDPGVFTLNYNPNPNPTPDPNPNLNPECNPESDHNPKY